LPFSSNSLPHPTAGGRASEQLHSALLLSGAKPRHLHRQNYFPWESLIDSEYINKEAKLKVENMQLFYIYTAITHQFVIKRYKTIAF